MERVRCPTETNPNGTALAAGERATRHGGWTLDEQQLFIDHLAANGRVDHAARMSVQSANGLRARVPGFAFGWRAAVAYNRLREIALDRASNGTLTPNCYRGEVASMAMRYSDRLILGLLDHLKPEGEINFATGQRDRAIEPATLWSAAVDAYAVAHETGKDPIVPKFDGDEVQPVMTREEFLAAIAPRPRTPPPSEAASQADGEGGERREYTSYGSPSASPL